MILIGNIIVSLAATLILLALFYFFGVKAITDLVMQIAPSIDRSKVVKTLKVVTVLLGMFLMFDAFTNNVKLQEAGQKYNMEYTNPYDQEAEINDYSRKQKSTNELIKDNRSLYDENKVD